MARHLRLEYEGAIYHIVARGNERGVIFKDDRDRERFVEKLAECVEVHGVRLYAYVQMRNHFHLLIETPRANLSAFMQQFNTSYTMFYNVRHNRTGHLFGGRYKAKVVKGELYLLRLSRYIHLNPVMIAAQRRQPLESRIADLRKYRWSSYLGYTGSTRPAWLDAPPLLALVGEGVKDEPRAYGRFVESGMVENDEELDLALARSSKAVGSAAFCRSVDQDYRRMAEKMHSDVDVSMRRVEIGVESNEICRKICEYFNVGADELSRRRSMNDARLMAVRLLRERSSLDRRAIGQLLGLRDGSGLWNLEDKVEERLQTVPKFRRGYMALGKELRLIAY